jgi:small conductance mechanosensitive channel
MTNQLPDLLSALPDSTVMGRLYAHFSGHASTAGTRLMLILVLAMLVHLAVKVIGNTTEWLINKSHAQKSRFGFVTHQPKFITFVQLIGNGVTFLMYFLALGLVLQELGVNLKGYLASVSIVALAISFGSQGLVQDAVISLTLIFSDTMDAGDMVEITGATTTVVGRVEEIGLRFTKLLNFYNQIVCIPNRTIGNVSRFPHGGIYAYADIQIPADTDRDKAVHAIADIANGMWVQFGAIILSEPAVGPLETAKGGGWHFVRVQFKIWPGQGNLIETTFRQQIICAMKISNPNYAEWQVTVTYRTMTSAKNEKPRLEPGSGERAG